MVRDRRDDPEVNRIWEEFHSVVNMTGHELRTWLLTEASNETGLRGEPDPGLPVPGRGIVDVLNKRKVDLTKADLQLMSAVVEQVQDLRANPPPDGVEDAEWRRALMDRGHDPLRESPEQEAMWPPS